MPRVQVPTIKRSLQHASIVFLVRQVRRAGGGNGTEGQGGIFWALRGGKWGILSVFRAQNAQKSKENPL